MKTLVEVQEALNDMGLEFDSNDVISNVRGEEWSRCKIHEAVIGNTVGSRLFDTHIDIPNCSGYTHSGYVFQEFAWRDAPYNGESFKNSEFSIKVRLPSSEHEYELDYDSLVQMESYEWRPVLKKQPSMDDLCPKCLEIVKQLLG